MISSPKTFLKVIQWWINDTILRNQVISSHAHGFVKQRSALTNARLHLGARHIVNMDIQDFFPSLTNIHVMAAFYRMGYPEAAALDLTKLTTLNDCLPQGAPTSPALSNIIFLSLDRALAHYAALKNLTYSRYADDLTFSSAYKISSSIVSDVDGMVSQIGLKLNPEKTKFMGPGQKLEVTGLLIGNSGVNIRRSDLNAARGWFHSACLYPDRYAIERSRIAGTVAMVRAIGGAQSDCIIALGERALRGIDSI